MNKLGSENGTSLSIGVPLAGYEGKGFFTRDFERKVRFCFIRRPCLLGTPGGM
jgi:hypothetical protein